MGSDPVQLAREMKTLRNEDGQATFMPEEWRTSKQISNMLSRLKAAQRKQAIRTDEVSEEDVEAAESEEVVDDLMRLVMDDMDRASQPMNVGAINICELAKSKKKACVTQRNM